MYSVFIVYCFALELSARAVPKYALLQVAVTFQALLFCLGLEVWPGSAIAQQDHALPYMADARHAPDTWFLIADEDFRVYKGDDVVPHGRKEDGEIDMDLVEEHLTEFRVSELGGKALADLEKEACDRELAARSGADVPVDVDFEDLLPLQRTKKAKASAYEDVSEELEDLVKIATVAARHSAGDLVWYSWSGKPRPRKGRKSYPWAGASLLGISSKAAKQMLEHFDVWFTKGHVDQSLLQCLSSNPEMRAQIGGASFLYPCIGHYQHDFSRGVPQEVRTKDWDSNWCQEGTRKTKAGQKHRTLFGFCAEGAPPKICVVKLPTSEHASLYDQYLWLTLRPEADKTCRNQVESSDIAASSSGSTTKATQKSARGAMNKRPLIQELERIDVVDDDDDADEGSKKTKNAKRRRRAALRDYARRIFTDDVELVFGCDSFSRRHQRAGSSNICSISAVSSQPCQNSYNMFVDVVFPVTLMSEVRKRSRGRLWTSQTPEIEDRTQCGRLDFICTRVSSAFAARLGFGFH